MQVLMDYQYESMSDNVVMVCFLSWKSWAKLSVMHMITLIDLAFGPCYRVPQNCRNAPVPMDSSKTLYLVTVLLPSVGKGLLVR